MVMTNIFAYRATDPNVMKAQEEPVGSENDKWLEKIAKDASLRVAAWGNHGEHMGRGLAVKELLRPYNLKCFRVTKKGQPEHPLYMPKSIILQSYE
jgi:hypothetical protein